MLSADCADSLRALRQVEDLQRVLNVANRYAELLGNLKDATRLVLHVEFPDKFERMS